jgi:signal peptidase II
MSLNLKKKFIIISGIIIVLDQVSKAIIKSSLNLYSSVDVIKGFFQIKYIKNSGAVWGFFSNYSHTVVPKIITAMSIIALIVIIYYFLKIDPSCKIELTSLSFIAGGAIGNNIDRILSGSVVDFLELYLGKFHWPTFNVADSFITIGVILLIISLWRGKCPSLKQNK